MAHTFGDDSQTAYTQTNTNQTLVKFVAVSIALHAALLLINLSGKTNGSDAVMYVNLTPETSAASSQATPAPETPKPVEPAPNKAVAEPAPEPSTPEPEPEPEPQAEQAAEQAKPDTAQAQPESTPPPASETAANDAGAASNASNAPTMDPVQWQAFSEIVPQFMQHWLYPAAARRQNIQGMVQIVVTVMPDGTVTNPRVPNSSGHPILDLNTIFIMRRVQQISPLPTGSGPIEVILNVPYQLNQGQ